MSATRASDYPRDSTTRPNSSNFAKSLTFEVARLADRFIAVAAIMQSVSSLRRRPVSLNNVAASSASFRSYGETSPMNRKTASMIR